LSFPCSVCEEKFALSQLRYCFKHGRYECVKCVKKEAEAEKKS